MGPSTKICPKCNQESPAEYDYCPHDGEKLAIYTPPLEESPEDSAKDLECLDESAQDAFLRGLCPKCGAYKNWAKIGEEYACQTCYQTLVYRDGKIYESKTKSTYQIEKEKEVEKEKERREAAPYAPILSSIDADNKEHWFEEFKKFDADPGYGGWNWPSFFFGPYRYLWKGIWKRGLLFLGLVLGLSFVFGLLSHLIMGSAVSNIFGLLFSICYLAIRAYLASVGAKDYYKLVSSFNGNVAKAKSNLNTSRVWFFIVIPLVIFLRVFG